MSPKNLNPLAVTATTGFDWQVGGLGVDTYTLTAGFGIDVIDVGAGVAETGLDRIVATDLYWENLASYRVGDHYGVVDITTGDNATILDFYDGTASSFDYFEAPSLESGTIQEGPGEDTDASGVADIYEVDRYTFGTDANDTITAPTSTHFEVVFGGFGDDTLYCGVNPGGLIGGGGNDHLYSGGASDDGSPLIGGSGADTYHVASGHTVMVADWGSSTGDVIDATSIATIKNLYPGSSTIAATVDSHHLVLLNDVLGTGVAIIDWKATETRIETLQLGDGAYSYASYSAYLAGIPNLTWEDIGESTTEMNRMLDGLRVVAGDDQGPTLSLTIGGTSGAELLYGFSGDNTLIGDQGDDTLAGRAGSDHYLLRSGDGSDSIDNITGAVLGDRDTLHFGPGLSVEDLQVTMSGSDAVIAYGASDGVTLTGWTGPNATLAQQVDVGFVGGPSYHLYIAVDGGDGDDCILGTVADESLAGGLGHDILAGGDGDDTLTGGSGDDTVYGGGGNDSVVAGEGSGDDQYSGGGGSDTITYASTANGVSVDLVAGTAGGTEVDTDTLTGFENVIGGTGSDTITGDDGNNGLEGGGGNDLLNGGDGQDNLKGGDGIDKVLGGGRGDIVHGGDDNDTVAGNGGDDHVYGDAGNDKVWGNRGSDDLYGGGGRDTLNGGEEEDVRRGGSGGDNLWGQKGNDVLFGEGGGDKLWGSWGDDVLDGGSGRDKLKGGEQDDRLVGGGGDDVLTGGSGTDVFVFAGAHDVDTITDFSSVEGDQVEISGFDPALVTYAKLVEGNHILEDMGDTNIDLTSFGGGMIVIEDFVGLEETDIVFIA